MDARAAVSREKEIMVSAGVVRVYADLMNNILELVEMRKRVINSHELAGLYTILRMQAKYLIVLRQQFFYLNSRVLHLRSMNVNIGTYLIIGVRFVAIHGDQW